MAYQINAPLRMSGGGGNLFGGDVGTAYKSAYDSALSMNSQMYNNILSGYQGTMQNQRARQKNVAAGYGQLQSDVLNRLSGTNRSNIQSIADQYAKATGTANQQLVDRGLGNTTVQQSVSRGLALDNAKAVTDSRNKFAQDKAQYQAQIGGAGLGFRAQAIRDNTDLANRQLGWMNTIQTPYPDASAYMKLGEMRAASMPPVYPSFGDPGGGGGGGGGGFGGGAAGGGGAFGGGAGGQGARRWVGGGPFGPNVLDGQNPRVGNWDVPDAEVVSRPPANPYAAAPTARSQSPYGPGYYNVPQQGFAGNPYAQAWPPPAPAANPYLGGSWPQAESSNPYAAAAPQASSPNPYLMVPYGGSY